MTRDPVPSEPSPGRSRRPAGRYALSALLLLLASSFVHAEVEQGMRRCAAVESDARRLECYDALARGLARSEPDPSESAWQWNPDAGGSAVELTLVADREVTAHDRTVRPQLVLGCRDGVLVALVRTGMPTQPEHDEGKTVLLQLDDDPAFTVKMTDTEEGRALQFASPQMVASQLLLHRKLLFQFLPEHSRRASVKFDTSGLDHAIEPLLDACALRLADDGFVEPR